MRDGSFIFTYDATHIYWNIIDHLFHILGEVGPLTKGQDGDLKELVMGDGNCRKEIDVMGPPRRMGFLDAHQM